MQKLKGFHLKYLGILNCLTSIVKIFTLKKGQSNFKLATHRSADYLMHDTINPLHFLNSLYNTSSSSSVIS